MSPTLFFTLCPLKLFVSLPALTPNPLSSCPPAPLKGGSNSNMNEFFLKNEKEPPFRGVGGQKTRENRHIPCCIKVTRKEVKKCN